MSSNQVMSLKLKASEKLVLMCLIKHTGKDNNKCYPSYLTMSEETGLSTKTIQRAVNSLVKLGYIAKENRIKPGRKEYSSNIYTVLIKMSKPSDNKTSETKALNKDLKDINTSCLSGQIEDIEQSTAKHDDVELSPTLPDEDLEAVKNEIETVIGAEIDYKGLCYLLLNAKKFTIQQNLCNWDRFRHIEKSNPIGFFIDRCVNNRPIPQQVENKMAVNGGFEQRQYSDDYYNSLYENSHWKDGD